ncbi:hypothetical protein BDR26DRAFT_871949 [Obelidium mucronatum]|nr:hypothetical protein BDR26DRAFT_871949 [Obelidium mucronatum]
MLILKILWALLISIQCIAQPYTPPISPSCRRLGAYACGYDFVLNLNTIVACFGGVIQLIDECYGTGRTFGDYACTYVTTSSPFMIPYCTPGPKPTGPPPGFLVPTSVIESIISSKSSVEPSTSAPTAPPSPIASATVSSESDIPPSSPSVTSSLLDSSPTRNTLSSFSSSSSDLTTNSCDLNDEQFLTSTSNTSTQTSTSVSNFIIKSNIFVRPLNNNDNNGSTNSNVIAIAIGVSILFVVLVLLISCRVFFHKNKWPPPKINAPPSPATTRDQLNLNAELSATAQAADTPPSITDPKRKTPPILESSSPSQSVASSKRSLRGPPKRYTPPLLSSTNAVEPVDAGSSPAKSRISPPLSDDKSDHSATKKQHVILPAHSPSHSHSSLDSLVVGGDGGGGAKSDGSSTASSTALVNSFVLPRIQNSEREQNLMRDIAERKWRDRWLSERVVRDSS